MHILSKHFLAQICSVLKHEVCSFSGSTLLCCPSDVVPVIFVFLVKIISSTDLLLKGHCSAHILFKPKLF